MDVIGFTRDVFDGVVAMSGCERRLVPLAFGCCPSRWRCFVPLRSNSAGLADGNWPDLRDEVELRHLKLLEHEFGPYSLNESTWKRCSLF